MKLFILTIMLAAASFGAADLVAESTRPVPESSGKANKRPPAPAATPTPAAVVDENIEPLTDGEVIKIDTQLVSVPVRVMDKKGRFVGGLTKENFKVFEDGTEQEVALFSNEHQPFTVALVLDMSYSTTFRIGEIQTAAMAFIDQLRPKDRVMVVSFDEEVHILCNATSDRKEIYRAIKSTKVSTGTSLFEAVDQVINDRMRRIEGRKAIILFTDGVDTTSRRTNSYKNLSDAMELDSLIYPIRYDTFADVQAMKNGTIAKPPPIPRPTGTNSSLPSILMDAMAVPDDKGTTEEEYRKAQEYLDQLALRTGGRTYIANTLGNLTDAFSKIASELREFYSIGYYPVEERVAGKKTNVKVRVDQPGLSVRSREGYIAPAKTK